MKLRAPICSGGLLLAVGLGLGSLAFFSHAAVAANAEDSFLALNETAMNKMMVGMAATPTADADRDFVAMMVPHHQGAIDMARAELQYGHNQTLVRLAQEIVVGQLQEIAAMRLAIGESASPTWVTHGAQEEPAVAAAHRAAPGSDAAFVSRSNAAVRKMMIDMAVKPTGNVDHDFVAMMAPHHQGAIDMSQAELQYGKNPRLKAIVQEIIVDQMQEITLMRLALGEPLPQSMPSPTQASSGAMQATLANQPDANEGEMRMAPPMQVAPTRPAATR
jgi:uncharacterized protein (DUF305 family)